MANMKILLRVVFFILVFGGGMTQKINAAPDPAEVEKIKSMAPVHMIGVVKDDILYKDLSDEMRTHYQIRKMTLTVKYFIKNSKNLPTEINVYYSYIPSWQVNQWEGGRRVDIALKDEIEIWLEDGEYGLKPALGGNIINHISYAEVRNEPIKESILQLMKRKLEEFWFRNFGVFVLIILLSTLAILIIIAKKLS